MTKCLRCGGTKKVMGMGFIQKDCPVCMGELHEKQDDGKQNQIESAENCEREAAMDQGETTGVEAEREIKREDDAMGARESHRPERKKGRKGH